MYKYLKLEKKLLKAIDSGTYTEKLPSERQLSEKYGVSRSTTRLTLESLARKGIASKYNRKGNFINKKPVEKWLGYMQSFNSTVIASGFTPRIKVVAVEKVVLPESIADIFGRKQGYYIERNRYSDNQLISIEKQYYPPKIGKKIAERCLENKAIFDILENDLKLNIRHQEQKIMARQATLDESTLFGAAEGLTVFLTDSLLFDAENKVIEIEYCVIRSDVFSFKVDLKR